jgi:hypothetical protein
MNLGALGLFHGANASIAVAMFAGEKFHLSMARKQKNSTHFRLNRFKYVVPKPQSRKGTN